MVPFKNGSIYYLTKCGIYQIYTHLCTLYKNAEQFVLESRLVTTAQAGY